jgi:hypothetical protein
MHGHLNVKYVEHVTRRCYAVDQSQDLKPTSACSVSSQDKFAGGGWVGL